MTRFEQSIFIITTLNGKMLRIRLVTRLLLDSHLFTQRHMYQKGVERLTTYWVSHIYSICWKIQTRINHTWGLRDGRCNSVSPGGGVSLYNGLYGKDPPERAPFFRASDVWKGWDFTSWSIWNGRSVERPKELTNAFRGREKVEKIFFYNVVIGKKKCRY